MKSKRIDSIISAILEDVIKFRPNYLATFIIEYIFRKYPEDSKFAWKIKAVNDLTHRVNLGISPNDYSVRNYVVAPHTDIQGDLDKYLTRYSVHQTLCNIVENLLLTESINPYVSIVEYLCQNFPEQGILALELHSPQKGSAKAITVKNIQKIMKSTESDSESEDEENHGGTAASPKKRTSIDLISAASSSGSGASAAIGKSVERRRRNAVSSESMNIELVKEQVTQIVVTHKEPDITQRLFHMISRSTFLRRMLNPEERALVVRALAGPVYKRPAENIITEGEDGYIFYLLEKGLVDVIVNRGTYEERVHSYRDGDTFGQLALMYNAPRAATCRAVNDVKLWTLDRISFKTILAAAAVRKREIYSKYLSDIPVFATLNEKEKLLLGDCLVEEVFQDGMVICREAEPGDELYIIINGAAEVCQTGPDASVTVIETLEAGQYYGELTLINSRQRDASLRAKGELTLAIIDRDSFNRVLGPLEELLKRNPDLHKKLTSD